MRFAPIIRSILDTDLYKLTQQAVALLLFPNAKAKYRFINRRPEFRFTPEFLQELKEQINYMGNLALSPDGHAFLRKSCPFLPEPYFDYLHNYRFDPAEVKCSISKGELELEVSGRWCRSILWETPLMAIISELWYKLIDLDWIEDEDDQRQRANQKMQYLTAHDCQTVEFGARRRRSRQAQKVFLEEACKYPSLIGTSNPQFAMEFGLVPKGTKAHELTQAMSVLMGLRHANRFALDVWYSVYKGQLGIALPDTYGLDAFFADFTLAHAKIWDGLRWDSGCPYKFTDRLVNVYQCYGIDPMTKISMYTNALDDKKAVKIREYTEGKIRRSFGVGTFFTNDFRKKSNSTIISPAMNMVVKMVEMDGVPVVKLSEDKEKVSGDICAVKDALWTFYGTPM